MASVRRLLLAEGHDAELGAFRRLLQPRISSEKLQIDVTLLSCESPVLQFDSDDECRNNSQSLLEDLLLYLVVRKFRATTDSAGGKVILGIDQQISVDWEGRDVAEFQSFVDVLHGLLLDNEWDAAAISSLNKVVKRIQDPRARQRFLTFAFQILRQASQSKAARAGSSPPFDVKFFDEAVRLLLLGVTDLWSAIRKDCAKNAAAIAFEFPSLNHIEQFMDSLLGVAVGSRSVSADKTQVTAWTEREGALLALSDLLCSIKMDSTSPQPENPKTSQVKEDIKGILGVRQSPAVRYRLGLNERHTFTQLPRCLVQTLKPAIYQCLRHDQLTVRQLAARCLVEYAALCETPTRLLIFQEVISKLNRMNRNDKVDESDGIANTSESELLDAFEAEGLLDVLARMAPCLPSRFLLRHWKFVFPTLEKYVMHIASSVRQKSSSVVLALAKLGLSGIQQGKSVDDELEPSANSAFDEASLKLIKLVEDWTIVWDGIAAMEMNPESFPLDTETAVGQVEIRLLAFLCFGGTADPPRQLTQLLDGALRAMHANLPQSLQLGTQMGNTVSANSSLDRQFSIFLVPMLPVVVSTMHYVAETVDSTAKDDVQPRDFGLSWYSRWLCLERIILSWLLCDDMFRWIAMNKSEAQSSLLESLSMLLHSPNSHQLYEEFDKIVQCLSDTFGAPQTKIKDATYTNLLDIYLQMWLSCTTSGNRSKEKLLVAIASLYSQRQQALTVSGVNGKQNSALESWDNWDDEEEIQQPSPVGEMQEPNGVTNQDALFQEVLKTLDASQLTLLHEAACATPGLEGAGDLSCQHVTRMQQQIEACLQL
ncbi:hypothetical protein PRNP1_014683 [Phytophthora ramorum]